MEQLPMPHEDMSAMEEIELSTPYSDVESWERVIEGQIEWGTSRFRGPPGLWKKVAARLASSLEPPTL